MPQSPGSGTRSWSRHCSPANPHPSQEDEAAQEIYRKSGEEPNRAAEHNVEVHRDENNHQAHEIQPSGPGPLGNVSPPRCRDWFHAETSIHPCWQSLSGRDSPDFGPRGSPVDFPLRLVAGQEAASKKRDAHDYKPGRANRIDGRVRKQPESDAGNETEAAQVEHIDPTRPRANEVSHDETCIPPRRQSFSFDGDAAPGDISDIRPQTSSCDLDFSHASPRRDKVDP